MSRAAAPGAGIRLERGPSVHHLTDALARSLHRVGLRGVLDRLDRRAEPVRVPAPAAVEGFRWDILDRGTPWWYPQGITTSADASASGETEGRRLVLTSWYSRPRWGRPDKGARVSVVDCTDPVRPRYGHVLLVEPFRADDGTVDLRPVRVHAGGICWYGGHLFVAATARGLKVFEIDDVIAVPDGGVDERIGRQGDGRYHAFGYRLVLPMSFGYAAGSDSGVPPMRYSFLSLDRTGDTHHLVAGEYGREGATTRLIRYPLDRDTGLLSVGAGGRVEPVDVRDVQVQRMQGAVVVHGSYAITTSRGRRTRGDLWTGRPGALSRNAGVLTAGPEDLSYWPARHQLWTLSEWPRRRWVYAIDAGRFLDAG